MSTTARVYTDLPRKSQLSSRANMCHTRNSLDKLKYHRTLMCQRHWACPRAASGGSIACTSSDDEENTPHKLYFDPSVQRSRIIPLYPGISSRPSYRLVAESYKANDPLLKLGHARCRHRKRVWQAQQRHACRKHVPRIRSKFCEATACT